MLQTGIGSRLHEKVMLKTVVLRKRHTSSLKNQQNGPSGAEGGGVQTAGSCCNSVTSTEFQSIPSSLLYLMLLKAFQRTGMSHPEKKTTTKPHKPITHLHAK